MSVRSDQNGDAECSDCADPAIELWIRPRTRDLGEFSVRRVLPAAARRTVGPWIFFDHMGPADFPPGEGIDVRPHPHIALATVTYLFEGEILHRDSLGTVQAIRPGAINLMIAGRGITHSERERPEVRATAHRLHGLQLWMALPEEHEETDPAFHHFPAASLPAKEIDGVPVRVMIGEAYGLRSDVPTFGETLYVEARLDAGQRLELPAATERALYVASGSVTLAGETVDEGVMAVLGPTTCTIEASEASRIAVLGGAPVGKRFIEWNFVASTRERIEQAKDDWRERRFPAIEGDDEEFIPLPE